MRESELRLWLAQNKVSNRDCSPSWGKVDLSECGDVIVIPLSQFSDSWQLTADLQDAPRKRSEPAIPNIDAGRPKGSAPPPVVNYERAAAGQETP